MLPAIQALTTDILIVRSIVANRRLLRKAVA